MSPPVSGAHPPATRLVQHESELGRWEIAQRVPCAELHGSVVRYGGFLERTPAPLRRRELASPQAVLVIPFAGALRVRASASAAWTDHRRGFVAGLQSGVALTEHDGVSRGVIVSLSALGARRLFGEATRELAGRSVAFDDVAGPAATELSERLYDAPTWGERFAILDGWITARLHATAPCPRVVAEALRRIDDSRGAIEIGSLAGALGCTRKHLHACFRQQIGMSPKLFARVARFDHAVSLFEGGRHDDWSHVARACGYYDQAHLIRDFHAFSGAAPGEIARRSRPDGGGISDDPGWDPSASPRRRPR